ncbi:hypothetical protein RM780_08990 [Streptomyces sp. DSM 44917]|uniref:Uncharacterized protein n=1 Tax=Streptomyces boetiae TaxID=3075541 RepID=A0ABU2L6B8_9ACTN|nr:hypothetical protein [Streptomyces sp. DSM 44917]MDT0307096.1 hypothetical protein [Streptomyces sp. DSM 44917]
MSWADGACVVDLRSGRVGRVVGRAGPRLRLRPLSAGRPWDCPRELVRAATEFEQRNADVLDATWRFWRPA